MLRPHLVCSVIETFLFGFVSEKNMFYFWCSIDSRCKRQMSRKRTDSRFRCAMSRSRTSHHNEHCFNNSAPPISAAKSSVPLICHVCRKLYGVLESPSLPQLCNEVFTAWKVCDFDVFNKSFSRQRFATSIFHQVFFASMICHSYLLLCFL